MNTDLVDRIRNYRSPSTEGGGVIVHNHIQHRVNTRNGTNGFRYWSDCVSDELVICHCGWRPREPAHFRVRRIAP